MAPTPALSALILHVIALSGLIVLVALAIVPVSVGLPLITGIIGLAIGTVTPTP